MTEFAFVFTIFLFALLGLIELGRGIWAYTTVAHAARQASRFAMVRSSLATSSADPHPIDEVAKRAAVGLDGNRLSVNKNWSTTSPGGTVAVTVSYPLSTIASTVLFAGDPINVSSTSRRTLVF